MTDIQFIPIGRIETPYRTMKECPRNVDSDGPPCRLVVDPALALGLRTSVNVSLSSTDFPLTIAGVFALRTPLNPFGAAVLTITAIASNVLIVPGLDCLDGTPLINIKPDMGRE